MLLVALEDHGHNREDFAQFMYHFPTRGDCGFAGLAQVGSVLFPARDSWYNGSFGCVVRNQEIGHNYGMGHSRSYACVDGEGENVPFSGECTFEEYGDPYDPMGGGCAHMNVVQKTFMGWIEDCNVVTATSDGRFNLMPTELPCDGTQALRFPAFDGRYYWLEYRNQLGQFDNSLPRGVLVHVAGEVGGNGPSPYILDVGDSGFLHAGDTFADPEGGVAFTIVEELETHAVIEAVFAAGDAAEPTCRTGGRPASEAGAHGSLACADAPIELDTTPPTVTITYPADGAVFAPGSDFVITAEAEDARGLTELELYVDSKPMFKKFEPPWEWDVTDIPEGSYEFGVVARDGPNLGASQAVDIKVTDEPVEAESSGGIGGGSEASSTGPGSGDGGTGETDTDAATAGSAQDAGGCGCGTSPRRAWPPMALAMFVLGCATVRRRV